MACSSSCPTPGAHRTYGECLRAKAPAVMGLESTGNDYTKTLQMHRDNAAYRAAVAEGLQPKAPTQQAVDEVRRVADTVGHAV